MALKPSLLTTTSTLLLLVSAALPAARGQQPAAASCTASLITSFTPCFSYLTNSSGNGAAAPTRDCCRSLAALVNASAGCACLVLTGAVPLGLGAGQLPAVNRTLAVSLPRACGSSTPVPLQCQDTSTPAAPGPVAADAPSQLTPLPPATPAEPTATAPVSQEGQTRQTTALPSSSARRRASAASVSEAAAAALLLLAVGAALV